MAEKTGIEWTDATVMKPKQRWTNLREMTDAQRVEHNRQLGRDSYVRRKTKQKAIQQPDCLSSISAVDLAYMAGLIDGEGSISCLWHAKGKTCYPVITVAMTDHGVIEWLGDKWDVAVSRMPRRAAGYLPQVFVRISGHRAKLLCALLFPYLHVKRRHAELVAEFPMDGRKAPGVTISPELSSRRAALRTQINSLNFKPRNPSYERGRKNVQD